jgi:cytosine/adenosine deaminase-related metal-dependent hydrolase
MTAPAGPPEPAPARPPVPAPPAPPLPVPVKLLVTDALLFTVDAPGWTPFTGWLAVGEDGRIAGLGAGDPGPVVRAAVGDVLNAAGKIVAPGFVSAHSHLFTSGSRGMAADQSLYTWIEAMTRYTRHATVEDVYWLARHGAQDFLANGITTAYDFTDPGLGFTADTGRYRAGPPSVDHQHAQLLAKLDAGIRSVHSVMLGQNTDDATVTAHLDEVVARAASLTGHPGLLRLAISGTVQWADDPSVAVQEVAAMRRHGLLNQPHFLETPSDVELQRSKFGWYRDAGALGPDLVFGHFIQTTDAIIAEAARAGCAMVWQPTSNGRLASGFAPIRRCRELGMRVGVGLDDQSCTDTSDPFSNLRFGIYSQRAHHRDPAAMAVGDMLELHTRGSAEALGIAGDVGSLAVGRYADFLVVDPRSPDTGPVWDPVGTYVLACGLRNLVGVYVGGELAADGGGLVDRAASVRTSDEVHGRLARIRADVDGAVPA